jgi:endoglucanase
MREDILERIDAAVEMGRKHGIHMNINLHRGPGYCVNWREPEPFDLWRDQDALDAFCCHWEMFAGRYKGIPSEEVSFNLLNEPPAVSDEKMTAGEHARVMRTAVEKIRVVDPDRLIIADGTAWATVPVPELADLGIAQSCRAYKPAGISHYMAPWAGGEKYPEPVWPGAPERGESWDRAKLEEMYGRWARLMDQGVGVHCGEGGSYNKTPHGIFLAWFRDCLEILTGHGIGYALWNFRGSFGILDSGREDADCGDWHGHTLDTKLLDLLKEF